VQSAFEVKEVERKPDREWGHLTLSATLVNQRGETVLEAFHVYRLRCRSVAAAGS
jgi:acyl dehydratase